MVNEADPETGKAWPRIWLRRLAAILAAPFNGLEWVATWLLTAPVKPVWRWLDSLAPRFEHTLARKVISVSLFPVMMVLAVFVGFELVERGLTGNTLAFLFIYFIVLGLFLAPLERLMPWSRNWLQARDSGTDLLTILSVMAGAALMGPVSVFLTAWLVDWIHVRLPPDTIRSFWPSALHPVLQVFLLLLVMDFFRYWYHRAMHTVPLMWRWHSVHHSSARMYWFNGVRSHPVEGLVQSLIWVVPYTLIQAPAEIVFVSGMVSRVIGRFQHTNVDAKLGPLEYVFSAPGNHRYHHSKIAAVGDRNYGGDFILWDLLFGTFHLPKGQQPSDDIGVGGMPHYPQTWLGLMLAPFNSRLWRRDPVVPRLGRAECDALADGTEPGLR